MIGNEVHRTPSQWVTPFIFVYLTPTTSREQGRHRKVRSGGSLRAKRRAGEQKRHVGLFPWGELTHYAIMRKFYF